MPLREVCYHRITFGVDDDINLCPDTIECESIGGDNYLKHSRMSMCDLLLRLSMTCKDHRCNKLMEAVFESIKF